MSSEPRELFERHTAEEEYSAIGAQIENTILGGPPIYSVEELAEHTGVRPEDVVRLWGWLGLPVRDLAKRAFTDSDYHAISEYGQLADLQNFDLGTRRSLARAVGNMAERLSTWQIEAVIDNLVRTHKVDDSAARLMAVGLLPAIAPMMGKLVEQAWRRQFAVVAKRLTIDVLADRGGKDIGSELPLRRAVGFCDVVGFSGDTATLDHEHLISYMEEISNRARDIIQVHGGRLIKTIGDAALYVADDIETGMEIALALTEQPEYENVVPVRVGLVWCRILTRYGDIFGPGVNLASRLSDLAEPSQVLVDAPTAELLEGLPGIKLIEQPESTVHGIGPIKFSRLERAELTHAE